MRFKGVIRSIKPNQKFKSTNDESNLKSIYMDEDGLLILTFNDEELVININEDFKIAKKEVTFNEAYELLKEGKEIESALTGHKYTKDTIVYLKEEVESTWYVD